MSRIYNHRNAFENFKHYLETSVQQTLVHLNKYFDAGLGKNTYLRDESMREYIFLINRLHQETKHIYKRAKFMQKETLKLYEEVKTSNVLYNTRSTRYEKMWATRFLLPAEFDGRMEEVYNALDRGVGSMGTYERRNGEYTRRVPEVNSEDYIRGGTSFPRSPNIPFNYNEELFLVENTLKVNIEIKNQSDDNDDSDDDSVIPTKGEHVGNNHIWLLSKQLKKLTIREIRHGQEDEIQYKQEFSIREWSNNHPTYPRNIASWPLNKQYVIERIVANPALACIAVLNKCQNTGGIPLIGIEHGQGELTIPDLESHFVNNFWRFEIRHVTCNLLDKMYFLLWNINHPDWNSETIKNGLRDQNVLIQFKTFNSTFNS